jgi:hypothetical protein
VALRLFPLLGTGGTAACGIEYMPGVAAGAGPLIGGGGFPVAFRAGYFYFGHDIWLLRLMPQIEKPGFKGGRTCKGTVAYEVRSFVFTGGSLSFLSI